MYTDYGLSLLSFLFDEFGLDLVIFNREDYLAQLFKSFFYTALNLF